MMKIYQYLQKFNADTGNYGFKKNVMLSKYEGVGNTFRLDIDIS